MTPGPAQADGLLIVFSDPPPEQVPAFNIWYEEVHVPARLRVPGILNARRYETVAPHSPRYALVYDLETIGALQTPEYLRLGAERSEHERALLASTPLIDRRLLKPCYTSAAWTDDAPYLVTVGLDPAVGAEADFTDWYRNEHIPNLLTLPGWRRCRLFEQVEGSGPAFLALHELDTLAVLETDGYRHPLDTKWRERVLAGITRRERSVFALLRTFPRPDWGIR